KPHFPTSARPGSSKGLNQLKLWLGIRPYHPTSPKRKRGKEKKTNNKTPVPRQHLIAAAPKFGGCSSWEHRTMPTQSESIVHL
ncbi:hypothetical protein TNCT_705221, partial [Trichonephila clavata]